MTKPKNTQEELEAEEKNRKAHLAQEARRILSEPMVEGFLRDQEAECFEALKRLPLGAKLEEYQVVHHDVLSIMRFKAKLGAYIQDFELIELQNRLGPGDAEDI